jgi:hypothetical protein
MLDRSYCVVGKMSADRLMPSNDWFMRVVETSLWSGLILILICMICSLIGWPKILSSKPMGTRFWSDLGILFLLPLNALHFDVIEFTFCLVWLIVALVRLHKK